MGLTSGAGNKRRNCAARPRSCWGASGLLATRTRTCSAPSCAVTAGGHRRDCQPFAQGPAGALESAHGRIRATRRCSGSAVRRRCRFHWYSPNRWFICGGLGIRQRGRNSRVRLNLALFELQEGTKELSVFPPPPY